MYIMLYTRELLKGPLYYASTITFCCMMYWRTSPISIAAICNLCAGDGNGETNKRGSILALFFTFFESIIKMFFLFQVLQTLLEGGLERRSSLIIMINLSQAPLPWRLLVSFHLSGNPFAIFLDLFPRFYVQDN